MNILVVGKKNHIPWPYYTARGFEQNGVNTQLFYFNEYKVSHRIKMAFSKKSSNDSRFEKVLKTFKPDIIVFVSAFFIPIQYYYLAKELNIYTIGWVGDIFGEDKIEYKDLIDKLYVFDSGLISLSRKIDFNVELLQVGYDPTLHINKGLKRENTFNFIGSYTKGRENILKELESYPLEVYGLKWNKLTCRTDNWQIKNDKIDYRKLIEIYNTSLFSLNLTQTENVSNGLNMRIYETIACGSCLITDNLKDISLCFEPNKELLVYNNFDELKEILLKVNKDKDFVKRIIYNAQLKLKSSDYTYKNRTKYMIDNVGA